MNKGLSRTGQGGNQKLDRTPMIARCGIHHGIGGPGLSL
jgi:hypothetical protein